MGFVNDGLRPGGIRPATLSPVEELAGHHTFRYQSGGVAPVHDQVCLGMLHPIAKYGITPLNRAQKLTGIWVDQQLVRIETVAPHRVVRPISAVAVYQPGL